MKTENELIIEFMSYLIAKGYKPIPHTIKILKSGCLRAIIESNDVNLKDFTEVKRCLDNFENTYVRLSVKDFTNKIITENLFNSD